ncbi:MAG: Uma2 family endonuclease [Chloroflexi bacterium]|nr:Uma2 family endonuclease [Chloroflexota bacterium]
MAIQQRLYDIDDLWRIVCEADDDKRYELIEGEIIAMSPTGVWHGRLVIRLGGYVNSFVEANQLGVVTGDTGYYQPSDRHNLLGPDIAFASMERIAQPKSQEFAPLMPDLAVEIKSPSNTMTELRRKADIYLRHGTRLVWIIIPDSESVEVHRLGAEGARQREVIGIEGQLSGEEVLPGFRLALSTLYA